MAQDLLAAQADELTFIETAGIEAAADALAAGDYALWHDLNNAWGRAEHYRAVINADPQQWTLEQGDEYLTRLNNLRDLISRVASAHGSPYRGNALPTAPAPRTNGR
jgi:hypothetical protein